MRRTPVALVVVALVLLAGFLSLGSGSSGWAQEGSPAASPDASPRAAPERPCLPVGGPGAAPVIDGVNYEIEEAHAYTFQSQAVALRALHLVFEPGGSVEGCFSGQTLIAVEHDSFALNVDPDECGFVVITKADGSPFADAGGPCGIPAGMDVPLEAGDSAFLDYTRGTITNTGGDMGALTVAALTDEDEACGSMPCP